MENKINIAELLKDCPKGMELYSPMFGVVYLNGIKETGLATLIEISTLSNSVYEFYPDGKFNTYYTDSECLLFPSKEQRDWSKFQRPFKDGDVVATQSGGWLGIIKNENPDGYFNIYCALDRTDHNKLYTRGAFVFSRFATEEEKEKLFKAIKDNGYKWNEETKTLEKLIEPKFKVGDRIKHKLTGDVYKVMFVLSNGCGGGVYDVAITNEIGKSIDIKEQDSYELVPNKFDITNLKAF